MFQGKYCNSCGQAVTPRFSLTYLWAGLREDLFGVEHGLLLTFRELWLRPGKMVLRYAGGETRKYYSPLKYLIFWTALYLIVISFTADTATRPALIDLIQQPAEIFTRQSVAGFMIFWRQLMEFHTNLYFLGLIPFFAVTNYIFHRKSSFNLMEIIILHTYFCGQFSFVGIIVSILTPALDHFHVFGIRLLDIFLDVPYAYLFLKMQREFFSESWSTAFAKGIMVFWLGTFSYLLFLYLFIHVIGLTAF